MERWFIVFNLVDEEEKLVTAFGIFDTGMFVQSNRHRTPEEIERAKKIAEQEFEKSGDKLVALRKAAALTLD